MGVLSKFEKWTFPKIVSEMKSKSLGVRFIVMIGDSGVGKSTTLNLICNLTAEEGSHVSFNSIDGTTTFFGIYLPDLNVVFIDTPGVSFCEEEWWQHIQQLTDVHGFIVLANLQGRNTGYKSLGYIYLQLQLNHPDKVKWYCVGNPRAMRTLSEDNYSYGKPHADVLRDEPAAIVELRRWAGSLCTTEHLNVVNPTQLIGRFKTLTVENGGLITRNETLATSLTTANTDHCVEVATLNLENKNEIRVLTIDHDRLVASYAKKIEEIRGCVDLLVDKEDILMKKCDNGAIESNGPDKGDHWYAWMPVAGTVILAEHIQQMENVLRAGKAAKEVTDKFKELDAISGMSAKSGKSTGSSSTPSADNSYCGRV